MGTDTDIVVMVTGSVDGGKPTPVRTMDIRLGATALYECIERRDTVFVLSVVLVIKNSSPDLWRKQTASDEWIEAFCNLVTDWKPIGWAEEKGQISAGVGPALKKNPLGTGLSLQ